METELKLALNAHDVPTLLAHPLLAGQAKVQRLLNTYFDTPTLEFEATPHGRARTFGGRSMAAHRQNRWQK